MQAGIRLSVNMFAHLEFHLQPYPICPAQSCCAIAATHLPIRKRPAEQHSGVMDVSIPRPSASS
jgi:hypothetical protein